MHDVTLRFILHQGSINKHEWLEACHNRRKERLGLAVRYKFSHQFSNVLCIADYGRFLVTFPVIVTLQPIPAIIANAIVTFHFINKNFVAPKVDTSCTILVDI